MGSSLLYISIAYYMQKGAGWVHIACKIVYVLNGRPHSFDIHCKRFDSVTHVLMVLTVRSSMTLSVILFAFLIYEMLMSYVTI